MPERIYGPYKQRNSYRVIIHREDGERRSRKFASSAEADAYIDHAREKTIGCTVKDAVAAYIQALIDRGLKFGSYERAEYHLERLLKLEDNGKRPITWLARRGQELYDASQVKASVDSHRNGLAAGKSFGRFCVKRAWLRADPFAGVDGVGRRKKGKPQMRIDEARVLTDYLLARCAPVAKPEPVAVYAVLLLGTRATELVVRDVRDLDDDGALLWIPDSKSDAGKRILELPDGPLRPLLRELAGRRKPDEPLFRTRDGGRPTRWWLAYWCDRLCTLAKVPSITPQGFRGTHGSFARRGGASAQIVQDQLGHASVTQTEGGSYVRREAQQAADSNAVAMRLVRGGKP